MKRSAIAAAVSSLPFKNLEPTRVADQRRILRRRDVSHAFLSEGRVVFAADRRLAAAGGKFLSDVTREVFEYGEEPKFVIVYSAGHWQAEFDAPILATAYPTGDRQAAVNYQKFMEAHAGL